MRLVSAESERKPSLTSLRYLEVNKNIWRRYTAGTGFNFE